ncbi:ATP-binding cassette sub-family C member 9 isoform X2 [Ischnura elegans]|uniref:ATP-binding cassette sub-family C member 9 isoform X2 n=1 Tax=Ischnura elegans TaxID=197161 RepID=UPI001ED8670C|nr:ATP-binding cassette sub-family C member 9 isoform X2 [Ischnura elegans]
MARPWASAVCSPYYPSRSDGVNDSSSVSLPWEPTETECLGDIFLAALPSAAVAVAVLACMCSRSRRCKRRRSCDASDTPPPAGAASAAGATSALGDSKQNSGQSKGRAKRRRGWRQKVAASEVAEDAEDTNNDQASIAEGPGWGKFHTWRCLLTLALFVVHLSEAAEALFPGGSPAFLAAPLASFLALVAATALRLSVSFRLAPTALTYALLLLWGIMGVAGRALRATQGREGQDAPFRSWAAIAATVLYSGHFLTDVVDICSRVREMRAKRKAVVRVGGETMEDEEGAHTSESTQRLPCAYRHAAANAFSKGLFYWLTPLLRLGYSRPLELEDLGRLPEEESTKVHFERFKQIFEEEKKRSAKGSPLPTSGGRPKAAFGKKVSLWRCYLRFCWPLFTLGGFLKLLGDSAGLVGPLAISVIIDYASASSASTYQYSTPTVSEFFRNGYVMAVVVLVGSIAQGTLSQASTHFVNVEGIRLKGALQALVYDKALHLSAWSVKLTEEEDAPIDKERSDAGAGGGGREKEGEGGAGGAAGGNGSAPQAVAGADAGAITNLVADDAFNVMSFIWVGHYTWAIPLKIGVLMYLLYLKLGISAIVGAAFCILTMTPLQFVIGKKMSTNSKTVSEVSDERLRKINEVLQGIKLLKLYGWEEVYLRKIESIRERELRLLDKDSFYWAVMTFLTHASSVLVTLVTFGTHLAIAGEDSTALTPANIFAALALFNQLTVPLFIFPVTVPIAINAMVSTKRLEEFLSLPEMNCFIPSQQDDSEMEEDDNRISNKGTQEKYSQNSQTLDDTSKTPDAPREATTPAGGMMAVAVAGSQDSVFGLGNIEEDEEEPEEDEDKEKDNGIGDEVEAENLEHNEIYQEVPVKEWIANCQTYNDVNTVPVQLSKPSKTSSVSNYRHGPKADGFDAVVVQNATFSWNADPHKMLSTHLLDISEVNIPQGKLTLVVGPVGSGKTSLLSALLGEMHLQKGSVKWASGATIAYAAQKPWLLNATLRTNVLFGSVFRLRRYGKVISAVALQPDMDILPEKDLTEIGEKGIHLSGGQKQRVALARTLYSRASIIMLDDPLSALDYQVGQHVFEEGIRKLLLRQRRTVVLVTHQLQLLSHAYHIIAMENGQVRIQGTLGEIERADPELFQSWKSAVKHEMESNREFMDGKVHSDGDVKNSEKEAFGAKTAKERWQLLRLVSKISTQLKQNIVPEGSWHIEDEARVAPPLVHPFRHRAGTQSSISRRSARRHLLLLSHDLPLPTDECHQDDHPLIHRRAPSAMSFVQGTSMVFSVHPAPHSQNWGHRAVLRASSLQSPPCPNSQRHPGIVSGNSLVRRLSTPSARPDPVTRGSIRSMTGPFDSNNIKEKNMLKRLMSTASTKSGSSQPGESDHNPIRRLTSSTSGFSDDLGREEEEENMDIDDDDLGGSTAVGAEEREYGKIPHRTYFRYLCACGPLVGVTYLASTLAWQALRVHTDFWLSQWADAGAEKIDFNETSTLRLPRSANEGQRKEMLHYLMVYAMLSLSSILLSLTSNGVGQWGGSRARRYLHEKMLSSVLLRLPYNFFEATPLGRIINRFSTDTAVIDKKIATSIQRLLQFLLLCLSAIVVNSVVTSWFLLAAIPICITYYAVQKFFRCSSRELQRLDSITRSPIFSHFSETLGGLTTIRAFGHQGRFSMELAARIDCHTNAFLIVNTANRWLGIALDYLGGTIVFVSAVAALITTQLLPKMVTPSLVGLAINYTLLLPIYLHWVVKFLSDMEAYMGAVERIEQYVKLPSEDEDEECSRSKGDSQENNLPLTEVPSNWPSSGDIVFEGVSLTYDKTRDPVIKNLNIHIKTGQKVGICGRTGSGKSSIVMSLFRMVNISEGRILIDGIDIQRVPKRSLRSRLSIIPQDVIMFSGTIRENLDPHGKFADEEIWKSLELAQLKEAVSSQPGGIDGEVQEGGENWSGGQRQLFCLARAILHGASCLFMDEATSSVDATTEAALQETATKAFSGRTVVTIAHRITTILHCDRILVLDGGQVVEDGAPQELMNNQSGIFSTMLKASESGAFT